MRDMLRKPIANLPPTRREFLHRAAGGFGAVALAGIWADLARASGAVDDPLAPRATHVTPRAKSIIRTGGCAA